MNIFGKDVPNSEDKLRQLRELERQQIEATLKKNLFLLGNMLTQRRERANLGTQVDISQKLGYVHSSMISAIERGSSKIPHDRMQEIAKAYQLDMGYFLMIATKLSYPDVWSNIMLMHHQGAGTKDMIAQIDKTLGEKLEKASTQGLYDLCTSFS